MPSSTFFISARVFFGVSLKKMGSNKALVSNNEVVVYSNRASFNGAPSQERSFENDIVEAFYDPEVLDIRRSMRFGLNKCFVEFNRVAVPVASPVISTYLLSPSLNSPEIPSEPATPALTLDSSSTSSTPELGAARELSLKDLKFLKLLSQGSSGQVFSVMDRVTRERRALKVIPHAGKASAEISMILDEQIIMRSLNNLDCPFHLKLDASFCDTRNFYFTMPLYPTDIESEIVRCGKLDVQRARFYFIEAYIALTKLHKDGIIHRDVKPANLMIDSEGHVVLADFGLSIDFNDFPTLAERLFQPYWPFARGDVVTGPETPHRRPEELTFVTDTRCGTLLHMSPEVVCAKPYSFPADVWALGVSLFMMLTGRAPFDTELDGFEDMKKEILESEVTFLPDDGLDQCAQDFLRHLLAKEPNDRLRLTELEEHPFFAGVDWKLYEKRLAQPPWIPGREPTHLYHTKAREFIPGVPFDGPSPYPAFEYTSDDIAAGIVRAQDIIDPADEPEEYCGHEESEFEAEAEATRPTPMEMVKILFKQFISPREWFRKKLTPVPMTMNDPCLERLGAAFGDAGIPPRSSPYMLGSSDSAPWASIRLNESTSTPPLPLQPTPPTCAPAVTISAPAPTHQGVWTSIRLWFSRLFIPRTCRIPDNGVRFDLLT